MKINRTAQAAREAEILIQAANERRQLNKMKLPGEPVLQVHGAAARIDPAGFIRIAENVRGNGNPGKQLPI